MEKQKRPNSLIEDIESELKKDADNLDCDFIDCRIDELYALDGLDPPKLNDEALDTAARTIRARAAWRRRNTQAKEARKYRFTRRMMRGTAAACGAFLFFFSANYLSTLVTGSCIPSKVGIKICCGTQFCVCETAEETDHRE
jgi:hypothetical protein